MEFNWLEEIGYEFEHWMEFEGIQSKNVSNKFRGSWNILSKKESHKFYMHPLYRILSDLSWNFFKRITNSCPMNQYLEIEPASY